MAEFDSDSNEIEEVPLNSKPERMDKQTNPNVDVYGDAPDETPQPEKLLLEAILERALEDLKLKDHKKSAIFWFVNRDFSSTDAISYGSVVEMLNLGARFERRVAYLVNKSMLEIGDLSQDFQKIRRRVQRTWQ